MKNISIKTLLFFILVFYIYSCSKEEVDKVSIQYVDYSSINTNSKINHKSRQYNAIDFIKQSYFTSYTNISIGELISAFDDIEWDDFIAEDDYMRYIDLIGISSDSNKYFFQFRIIDSNHWELYAFEINDKPYTVDGVANTLYSIYEKNRNIK